MILSTESDSLSGTHCPSIVLVVESYARVDIFCRYGVRAKAGTTLRRDTILGRRRGGMGVSSSSGGVRLMPAVTYGQIKIMSFTLFILLYLVIAILYRREKLIQIVCRTRGHSGSMTMTIEKSANTILNKFRR